MKTRNAEILLAAVIVARATSYVMNKISMDTMGPMNVLAVRFLLAFIIVALIFFRKLIKIDRRTLMAGLLVGAAFFVVMAIEMLALDRIDSSQEAFLENTAVVFVPLINAVILRKAPNMKTFACAVITLAGVGFLTLGNGLSGLGSGELLGILSGITYAAAIIITGRAAQGKDALSIGIIQLGTMGILSLFAAFAFETPHLPDSPGSWAVFMYLAIVCSCFGFTLQPVAQKYVSAEKAGMLCALSPLAAAVMGMVFLSEKLGVSGAIGGLAIMAGILLETYFELKDSNKDKNTRNS